MTPLRHDAADASYRRSATLVRQPPVDAAGSAAYPAAERYRPRQLHARGGMGEVWLADDAQIGRRVALKRLRIEHRNAHDRFLTEARITGQLEHPSIVPLHDLAASADGKPFYVMKFVEGRSLKEVIAAYYAAGLAQDWPRDVEFVRLLAAFVSICRAVSFAHSKGVIHRDIKPDNIMLGSFGESLLLDWGLAKVSGQADVPASDGSSPLPSPAGDSARTQAGDIMGSPAYMSPELAEGHADSADPKTDVYLFGATLYEMLTGRAPGVGDSQLDTLRLARTTSPLPPRKVNARIPRPLEAICLKAMAHCPGDRYASAGDLAEDVERYLAGEPVSVYREPLLARAGRWARRHQRGIQRGLVGGLVLALTVFAWSELQQAKLLAQREAARGQLADFRRLADEARFLAASTDPVSEQAPYYDPRRAIAIGETAIQIAQSWGPQGQKLANVPERSGWEDELYDLLLVLANAECQAESQPQGSQRALLLLNRAAAVAPGDARLPPTSRTLPRSTRRDRRRSARGCTSRRSTPSVHCPRPLPAGRIPADCIRDEGESDAQRKPSQVRIERRSPKPSRSTGNRYGSIPSTTGPSSSSDGPTSAWAGGRKPYKPWEHASLCVRRLPGPIAHEVWPTACSGNFPMRNGTSTGPSSSIRTFAPRD